MITLRPYQQQGFEDIYTAFSRGLKHVIFMAATGWGKTILFCYIASRVLLKDKKVLILTDRAELLRQAGGSLKKFNIDSFFIEAGCKRPSKAFNAYVAMSQTLRRRIDIDVWRDWLSSIDLIIIDEAHKQEFNYLFESGLLDNKRVIGFTATPHRTGKMRQLGLDYERIIKSVSIRELIEMGFLVGDDYYGIGGVNLDDVEYDRMKGDYKENALFDRFNSAQLYAGTVENYKKICDKTKTICFCVNIEHTIKTAIEFYNEGYAVKFLVSDVGKPKYPKNESLGAVARYKERLKVYELYQKWKPILSGERQSVLKWFNETSEGMIFNAGILTTGFDQPDIETVILNRATLSLSMLLQMLGRGSRIFPSKTHFNVLDLGDNCGRLGHYAESRDFSLWHNVGQEGGVPPIKNCGFDAEEKPIRKDLDGCGRPILASFAICPFCGYKYPDKKLKKVDLGAAYYNDDSKAVIKTKHVRNMDRKELFEYRAAKGHKMAWLWRVLYNRGGKEEIEKAAKEFKWSEPTKLKALNYCTNLLN